MIRPRDAIRDWWRRQRAWRQAAGLMAFIETGDVAAGRGKTITLSALAEAGADRALASKATPCRISPAAKRTRFWPTRPVSVSVGGKGGIVGSWI